MDVKNWMKSNLKTGKVGTISEDSFAKLSARTGIVTKYIFLYNWLIIGALA